MAKLIDDSDGRIPANATFKVLSSRGVSSTVKDLAQKCSEALLGREYDSMAKLERDVQNIGADEVRLIGSSTYGYFFASISPHPLDSDKDTYRDLGLELEIQY